MTQVPARWRRFVLAGFGLAALRWAIRQAVLTDVTVEAVMAWQVPVAPYGYDWAPISVDETGNLEEPRPWDVAGALLGSVGQYCVHHARCPVLIVRGEPRRAAA